MRYIFLICFILLLSFNSNACQCGNYEPFEEEFANATTILIGKIISKRIKSFRIKTHEGEIIKAKYYTFKIRVKETFKGEKAKIIEVVGNSINAAACGMKFKRWKTYVTYLFTDERFPFYFTSECHRNFDDKHSMFQDELKLLKEKMR